MQNKIRLDSNIHLVDSHCHLNLLAFTEPTGIDAYINRAQQAGVSHILNVAINTRDFPTVLKTAEKYAFVSASVGLHPDDQEETIALNALLALGAHQKVVAIGETGLDYYRQNPDTEDLTWQRDRFKTHIAAAKILQKPLIIHTRAAKEDTIKIMREEKADSVGGVMHCFTEDWEMAEAALALGFYISISGIVTFKNAKMVQEVAKRIPLNRLLIETDAPYLAPMPFRGKPNEPAYVAHTAAFLADLRQEPLSLLAQETTANFFTLFKGAINAHV